MSSHFAANAASRLRRAQQPTSRSTSAAGHHSHHHFSTQSTLPPSNLLGASQQSSTIPAYPAQTQNQQLQPQQQSTTSTTSSVRRNLFKTLKTASASMAGASSRATKQYLQPSSSRKRAQLAEAPTDAVFDDQDARVNTEDEDILVKQADGEWEINLPEMDESIDEDEDDEEDDEREQLRLANIVKQQARSDLSRHLPDLLKLKLQSLQEDAWMYEEEESF